jgi:hypothetical protein
MTFRKLEMVTKLLIIKIVLAKIDDIRPWKEDEY